MKVEPQDSGPIARTCLRTDFRDHPRLARTTRKFLHEVYSRLLLDPGIADRVSMAAYELLENLVKYSLTASSVEVTLHVQNQQARVHIRTCNTSHAERLVQLGQTLDVVISAPDPEKLYEEAIAQCATSNDSQLGFARIRAEAGMQLTYTIVGNEVTIDADWLGAL